MWLDLYNGFQRTKQWPDGGAYVDQPAIVIAMFQAIESQEHRERTKELEARRNG